MKARWRAMSAKFAALQHREKVIVAGATVLGIVMVGYSFWVEPASLRVASLKKRIATERLQLQTLQAQVLGMTAQLKDPDAANKAALADVARQRDTTETALHQYDHTLVPPERVPQLLQSLFARHRGLELVSLQTLAPIPLLAPPAPKADAKPAAKAADAKPPAPAALAGGNIHKHGIEIKMAGNYLDLLAYVADLEQLPQKMLWGSMSLAVTGYPKSEMTLTVYTLSLDSIWLVV